jgi:predicted nucleic acid-binding protein
MTVGLLDTSVFIARESGPPFDLGLVPDEAAVSAVTIGELRWAY